MNGSQCAAHLSAFVSFASKPLAAEVERSAAEADREGSAARFPASAWRVRESDTVIPVFPLDRLPQKGISLPFSTKNLCEACGFGYIPCRWSMPDVVWTKIGVSRAERSAPQEERESCDV